MTEAILVAAAGLLAYTYVGYPILVFVWARVRARPVRRGGAEPSVTIVIVAHDEAARIETRIENLLNLDYPHDRLEVVIASDGSTDRTVEIARQYETRGVVVRAFETRRGKTAVLNDVVPRVRGEIVVLGDSRQRFDAGAVRSLVASFADARVGAVSGELVLTEDEAGAAVGEGVGFYWRYEKFLRIRESLIDSTVGATGALYAIRRDLFEPIPADTILDDVLIPMQAARRGYRTVFERTAVAYDRVATTPAEEFTRKVRTIAGNFQLFFRERWMLDPFRNRLWLQTWSHKVLRLGSPLLLLVCLVASAASLDRPVGRWSFAGQALFYGMAVAGYALRNSPRKPPLIGVPSVFCLLQWATAVAFFRWVSGRQQAAWDRYTPRSEARRGREVVADGRRS